MSSRFAALPSVMIVIDHTGSESLDQESTHHTVALIALIARCLVAGWIIAIADRAVDEAGRQRRDGRGRRRAVDLRVSRGDGAHILDFPKRFTPPAQVVTLDRNYRSTQPILAAANAVIGLAPERFTKNLWTDRASSQKPKLVTVRDGADQACYVAERVLEHRESGIALKSQAVLFRSSSHSAQLELDLARRGIPFVKHGGSKFLEAAHVKDVLCVLRWAEKDAVRHEV